MPLATKPAKPAPVSLRISPSTRSRVDAIARSRGVPPHRVLVSAVEAYVAAEAEITAALAEADDPGTQWVSNDTIKADAAAQRAALMQRIATAA